MLIIRYPQGVAAVLLAPLLLLYSCQSQLDMTGDDSTTGPPPDTEKRPKDGGDSSIVACATSPVIAKRKQINEDPPTPPNAKRQRIGEDLLKRSATEQEQLDEGPYTPPTIKRQREVPPTLPTVKRQHTMDPHVTPTNPDASHFPISIFRFQSTAEQSHEMLEDRSLKKTLSDE